MQKHYLFFASDPLVIFIFSIMLNSTCDDSMNTNTDLKYTSIDLLQLRTLWNIVVNTESWSLNKHSMMKFVNSVYNYFYLLLY